MKNTTMARRYFKEARKYVGLPQADLCFEIGNRWKDIGISVTCLDCARRCKVAGVNGKENFWCGKKEII